MNSFFTAACLLLCCGSIHAGSVDRYGGNTEIKRRATGWFRLERIEERWFFITPEGNAFFSLGVTHTGETIRQDERGILQSRYGGDEAAMSRAYLEHLRGWGYNSAGYGAFESFETEIPYLATIWTEGPRSKSAGLKSRNSDIFDPAVQERLRGKVRAAAARHVGNPFCLGYVFIDLPIWSMEAGPGGNYVEFIRSLPDGAPGRLAFAAHPDADDETLMNLIAATYYTVVCEELRRIDPHHLIFGDRFMAQPANEAIHTPDSILKTAARFVDAFAFQPMGTGKPIRGYLDHVLALTGKPSLLADVNTMTMRPDKDPLSTSDYERSAGEHTLAFYEDAASSVACLGLHRCTLRDYQPWNPQFHRRGLLRADDTPYPVLGDFTRRTNEAVMKIVYGTP